MAEPRKSMHMVLEKLHTHIEIALKTIERSPRDSYEASNVGWSVKTLSVKNHRGKPLVLVECTHALARVAFFETEAENWGYEIEQADKHNTRWHVSRK